MRAQRVQQAAVARRPPAEANDILTAALGRLFAVAEAYPELKASENFLRLQDDLTDTEDKISAARRYYNATVMRFNTAVQSIPWLLLARPFGFREREFFSAEGDTAVPEVSFARRDVTLQQQIRSNRLRSLIVDLRVRRAARRRSRGLIGARLRPLARSGRARRRGLYGIFALIRSREHGRAHDDAHELVRSELRPLRRLRRERLDRRRPPRDARAPLVDDPAPNAFAAGLRPETSYVGVTTGLLRTMPKRELEAVLAPRDLPHPAPRHLPHDHRDRSSPASSR